MADPKLGRPPLDPVHRAVPVHVKLPPREYDSLYADARRQAITVPELIRRTLREKTRQET